MVWTKSSLKLRSYVNPQILFIMKTVIWRGMVMTSDDVRNYDLD